MSALHEEAAAALKRIQCIDASLGEELKKSVAFAIFPSVGRTGVVVGGAYGRGVVYEGGHSIGEASVGQFSIGVQVGGQTFSLIVFFHTREALERFKHGRIAFTANASAAIVKAAATGTSDYEKDVVAKAYSQGGMLLEASLGAQGFRFKPDSVLGQQPVDAPRLPEAPGYPPKNQPDNQQGESGKKAG